MSSLVCTTCGGTGFDLNGDPCKDCSAYDKLDKFKDSTIIPHKYIEARYLPETTSNPDILEFINKFNKTQNYIIVGKDSTGKLTICIEVLKRLMKEGKPQLPILSVLHLEQLIKAISSNTNFTFEESTVFTPEHLRVYEMLVIRITSFLSPVEMSNLIKLISYRELYSRGVVIITRELSYVKDLTDFKIIKSEE